MNETEFEDYKNSTIDTLNNIFKTKTNFEDFVKECIELYFELLKKGSYNSYEYTVSDDYYETVYKKSIEKLNIKYNLNITDDIFELFFAKGSFLWFAFEYGL